MPNIIDMIRSYYSSSNSDAEFFSEGTQSVGVLDSQFMDVLYPVDPETGLVNSDLSKLFNPLLTSQERADVMGRLTKFEGLYLPDGLSDDDILSIIPPRYLQDAVDIQAWRDYVSSDIIPNITDGVTEGVTKIVDDLASSSGSNVD